MRTATEICRALNVTAALTWRLGGDRPSSQRQDGYICGLFVGILGGGDAATMARRQVLEQVFGHASTKMLSVSEASAIINWLQDPNAEEEVHAVLREWALQRGQLELGI